MYHPRPCKIIYNISWSFLVSLYCSREIPFCRQSYSKATNNSLRTLTFPVSVTSNKECNTFFNGPIVLSKNFKHCPIFLSLIFSTTVGKSNSSSSTSSWYCSFQSTSKIFEISLASRALCNHVKIDCTRCRLLLLSSTVPCLACLALPCLAFDFDFDFDFDLRHMYSELGRFLINFFHRIVIMSQYFILSGQQI